MASAAFTYREFYARSRQLAHALTKAGVRRGDTVAILAANTPAMLEAHFAAPMIGAVLNPINIRLDAPLIAFCLEHGEAKVLLADREFHATIAPALELRGRQRPIVIDIADAETQAAPNFGEIEYEDFIASGDAAFAYPGPEDEWDSICLLYTSGTTGNPKGAVYSHRGAYLGALANALTFKVDHESRYLWTLPMFHCSGLDVHVGRHGRRRHARVPAQGRAEAHLRRHRRAPRHAHVRGADRAQHARACPGRCQASPARAHQGCNRRSRPARRRHRAYGGPGLRRAAPLRHDGELRTLHLLRADGRMAGVARAASATR